VGVRKKTEKGESKPAISPVTLVMPKRMKRTTVTYTMGWHVNEVSVVRRGQTRWCAVVHRSPRKVLLASSANPIEMTILWKLRAVHLPQPMAYDARADGQPPTWLARMAFVLPKQVYSAAPVLHLTGPWSWVAAAAAA